MCYWAIKLLMIITTFSYIIQMIDLNPKVHYVHEIRSYFLTWRKMMEFKTNNAKEKEFISSTIFSFKRVEVISPVVLNVVLVPVKTWQPIRTEGISSFILCIYFNFLTFRGFESQVTCLVTTQKDDKLICGFEDGSIQVRDVITGTLLKILSCHKKKVTALKLCKTDSILISGNRGKNETNPSSTLRQANTRSTSLLCSVVE